MQPRRSRYLRHRRDAGYRVRELAHDGALARASVAAVVTFGLAQNLLFNFQGFSDHVRRIVGPGVVRASLAGHLEVVIDAVRQLGWSLSWPGFVICLVGLAVVVRRQKLAGAWILLPIVSYYVFFIAVIRYHYDRWFLGVLLILALFGGKLLADILASARTPWPRLATGVFAVYLIVYASVVDIAMMTDSRYHVEEWFERFVPKSASVAVVGFTEYLPRLDNYTRRRRLSEDEERLGAANSDYVVTTEPIRCRAQPGTNAHAFYTKLGAPESNYVLVLEYRTDLPLTALASDVFRTVPCDGRIASNLDKINPRIRVFRRADLGQVADPPGVSNAPRDSPQP